MQLKPLFEMWNRKGGTFLMRADINMSLHAASAEDMRRSNLRQRADSLQSRVGLGTEESALQLGEHRESIGDLGAMGSPSAAGLMGADAAGASSPSAARNDSMASLPGGW